MTMGSLELSEFRDVKFVHKQSLYTFHCDGDILLVRNMGLKKPETELWTLTVCDKRPTEIHVQTKYAINTQHLNVFTSVLHVAAHSNRHQVDCV